MPPEKAKPEPKVDIEVTGLEIDKGILFVVLEHARKAGAKKVNIWSIGPNRVAFEMDGAWVKLTHKKE